MKEKVLSILGNEKDLESSEDLNNTKRQNYSRSSDTRLFEIRIGRQKALGFDPFISPKEAAAYLGVSVRFVYERIFNGELESQPMGRLRRIRLSTLENWLIRQQNGEVR